ncbi:MAG: nucleotidyltransferase [Bacteroidota bacterium]
MGIIHLKWPCEYPFGYSTRQTHDGNFNSGTMIQPLNDDNDLDVDLVCRLEGKQAEWTQADLKWVVGNRLKQNRTIEKLLVLPDGRRCWTIKYSESAKFHMDVLPAIVSSGYRTVLEKAFAARDIVGVDSLAIRITDKKEANYRTATRPEEWLKCNPFGYAIWFEQTGSLLFGKSSIIREGLQPVPLYRKEKLPLQRVVQLLKRHRDMMFNGEDDKPISIIITTLAARAYRKEANIIDALLNIVRQMPNEIEERYSPKHGRNIRWIVNPVNPEENFADKWPDERKKEENFYRWMRQVDLDLQNVIQQRGIPMIQESLEKPFGKDTVRKAIGSYAENLRILRESGGMRMAAGTGALGSVGPTTVKKHTFHGR